MKRINPTFLKYGAIIVGLVILFIVLSKCSKSRKEYTPVVDLQAQLSESAKRVKYLEDANGQLVADNTAIKASSAKEVKALSDELFKVKGKVKDVRYVTKLEQVVKHDTTYIPYLNSDIVPTDTIHVPKAFAYTSPDSNMYLKGLVMKDGLRLDSNYRRITTYLRHGTRKTGFLGLGREDFVQAIAPDTTVFITGLSTITYKVRPNAWNRIWKPIIAAGLAAGGTYYIMKQP